MMSHEPQNFSAPDGTAMVILTAAEYGRLRRLADEAEDVADGRAIAARIAGGSAGVDPRRWAQPRRRLADIAA